MLLAIDIGNTNITIGMFEGERLVMGVSSRDRQEAHKRSVCHRADGLYSGSTACRLLT